MKAMLKATLKSPATPWLLLAVTLALTGTLVLRATYAPSPPDPLLKELAAKIQERGREYGKGLELIVSGDAVMGRNLVASATNRMNIVAEECMRMKGCSIEVFVDSMSSVLEEQRIALAAARELRGSKPAQPSVASTELTDSLAETPHFPEMKRAVTLLRGVDFEELITLNGPVKSALNDWLTWRRPRLADAYENYLFLREETAPIFEKAHLPEALLFAVMAKETGGKVHAYSSAGAAGPLQFMPRTGMRYGLIRVNGFDMRLDPVASAAASAEYLNDQLGKFNNDLEKALAAYNGGESRLARLHRKSKGASFWDPQLYYAVPTETRNYVPAVLAAAWIFLHPEDYLLEFPELEVGTTTIELKEDTSIGELTICLGQAGNRNGWFRTLRNLNPRMKADQRINAGEKMRLPSMLVPTYVDRCSGNSPMLALARELHNAAYEEEREQVHYRVKKGDTLAAIAGRFGCKSVKQVARANGITGPNYAIHVGQRLTVPRCT